MISYKEVTLQDIPHIQYIANDIWPRTFGPLMTSEQLSYMMKWMYSSEALYKQMTDEGQHFIMAFEGDKPLAYCSYELYFRNKPQLMMHKLYLHSSSQGKGIGSALLQQLEEIARENHQDQVRLQVLHTNEKALGFYLKKGFTKTDEEYKELGNDMGHFLDYVFTKEV